MPRAKTPPEGGTGGFFVRGGVQTSTMKKSDNVDDHVFMPGEKIGEAFHLSAEEKKPVVEPDNDGFEGFDRDMRDAKRAANGKSSQIKGPWTTIISLKASPQVQRNVEAEDDSGCHVAFFLFLKFRFREKRSHRERRNDPESVYAGPKDRDEACQLIHHQGMIFSTT